MKKLTILLLLLSMVLSLCSCHDEIDDKPPTPEQTTSQSNVPDNVIDPIVTNEQEGERTQLSAEHLGSYLTMCLSEDKTFPYFKVFKSYGEVSEYYESTAEEFFYGAKFTLTCASFDDEFFKEKDVLMLVLDDTTSYLSFLNSEIVKNGDKLEFHIERHLKENAPLGKSQYHLIFTAPKGEFEDLSELEPDVKLYDVIDNKSNNTFDTERYTTKYPEYWPFVYRCDSNESADMVITTIQSYPELISFYEQNKDRYDLESELKKHIGSVYDERTYFNDYLMIALILPTGSQNGKVEVDELFVYNLELYLSVKNTSETVINDSTECYLLMVSVARKDLEGVNLDWCNISLN